jgi:serine/threonine protein kinase
MPTCVSCGAYQAGGNPNCALCGKPLSASGSASVWVAGAAPEPPSASSRWKLNLPLEERGAEKADTHLPPPVGPDDGRPVFRDNGPPVGPGAKTKVPAPRGEAAAVRGAKSKLPELVSFPKASKTSSPTRPGSPSMPTVALLSQPDSSNPGSGSQARPPMSVVGAYRLLSLLGEGGMGRVYLAEHVKLGRRVALKMLRSEFANNPNAVRRFFDEARAVNQIRHDNIIEVTDFVEGVGGGESYFIMELLVGTDLAQLQINGPLPMRRVLHVARQVCSALAAAHDAGIVHRDLKPENVFIVNRGGDTDFVKLLDFGVAKLTDPLHSVQGQTQAGAILGTPEYMSPEQAGGTAVDHRTDIYAFGVILYELVAGRRPFNGQSFGEYVIAHLSVAPTPPSQLTSTTQPVPEALEALILQCLAKPPAARPQTMKAVGERLQAIEANLDSEKAAVRRPKRRRSFRIWALGTAMLVLLAAVASQSLAHRSAREPLPLSPDPSAPMQTVRVSLSSSPQGAEVFREGSDAPLGVTPLEWSTERSPRPVRFEFRFPGHNRAWQEIVLDKDSSVSVALAELPPAGTPKPEPGLTPHPPRRGLLSAEAPPEVKIPKRAKKAESPEEGKADPPLDRDAVADPFAE